MDPGAEMLDSEFEWVSRQGDVLIRAWDPDIGEFLISNEIQLRYSSEMPRRMRAYAGLAEEKFKLPVYPVLVLICQFLRIQKLHQPIVQRFKGSKPVRITG